LKAPKPFRALTLCANADDSQRPRHGLGSDPAAALLTHHLQYATILLMSDAAAIAAPNFSADTGSEDSVERNGPDEFTAAILRAKRRLRVPEELTEIGMELTRALSRQVLADQAAAPANDNSTPQTATSPAAKTDPATSFSRLSRAVRLTLNLEARVEEALRALREGRVVARQTAARRATEAATTRREATRERVKKLVNMAIDREPVDAEALNELEDALDERLHLDSAYRDCEDRPIEETVRRLCADLGLMPDWTRWTGDGWLDEHVVGFRPPGCEFNTPSRTPIFEDDGYTPYGGDPSASTPDRPVRLE